MPLNSAVKRLTSDVASGPPDAERDWPDVNISAALVIHSKRSEAEIFVGEFESR